MKKKFKSLALNLKVANYKGTLTITNDGKLKVPASIKKSLQTKNFNALCFLCDKAYHTLTLSPSAKELEVEGIDFNRKTDHSSYMSRYDSYEIKAAVFTYVNEEGMESSFTFKGNCLEGPKLAFTKELSNNELFEIIHSAITALSFLFGKGNERPLSFYAEKKENSREYVVYQEILGTAKKAGIITAKKALKFEELYPEYLKAYVIKYLKRNSGIKFTYQGEVYEPLT